tara:strand:+ start:686 stop:1141 length:456 start_codon:yes stop_codon:yes gene_type:complete
MIKYIKLITVIVMSFLYIKIGIKHFIDPNYFLNIMPPYLPFRESMVYISGFFEIYFGFLLLFKQYRYYAGWGLFVLLFLVFPANIYLAYSVEAQILLGVTPMQAIIRLPFQLPLLLLAYWYTRESNNISFFSKNGDFCLFFIFLIYNLIVL